MKLKTFRIGGIHVPEHKDTPADHIIEVDLPMQVAVTMKQHLGSPAAPIVKVGDMVKRYQKIAEATGVISASVHSPITGTVTKIAPVTTLTGFTSMAIHITASEDDHKADTDSRAEKPVYHSYENLSATDIKGTLADFGVVGLGGATFPTSVKLSPPKGTKAEVLIINAAECEPYLTCDDALMRAYPQQIVTGIRIMMKAADVKTAVIGIENNKPEAIIALSKAIEAANLDDKEGKITIQPLKTKYPQGGEKQLIAAITGRQVPSGALPIAVGAIVNNVATAFAVYRAIVLRQPLVERVITIAGHANYLVPIGMELSQLPVENVEQADVADVVIGGPMMGRSAVTLDAPIEKGTSGVTVLQPLQFEPEPCIRCGECTRACPMGLEPYLIATLSRFGNYEEAVSYGAKDCIECGSCVYSCPSARPILDFIRIAKKKK